MRKYELILVFMPSLSEDKIKAESDKLVKFIEANGGQKVSVDRWGKRDLAYRSKKVMHGTYVCFYFATVNNDIVQELNRSLRINESVILFQSHRVEERERKHKGRPARKGDDDASMFA